MIVQRWRTLKTVPIIAGSKCVQSVDDHSWVCWSLERRVVWKSSEWEAERSAWLARERELNVWLATAWSRDASRAVALSRRKKRVVSSRSASRVWPIESRFINRAAHFRVGTKTPPNRTALFALDQGDCTTRRQISANFTYLLYLFVYLRFCNYFFASSVIISFNLFRQNFCFFRGENLKSWILILIWI